MARTAELKRKVCPTISTRPVSFSSAARASASATVPASGFSTSTCTPALRQRSTTSRCVVVGVRPRGGALALEGGEAGRGRLGAGGEARAAHGAGEDAGVMRPPQAESDQADAQLPGFRHGFEARGLWHRGTAIRLESGATRGRTVF